VKGFKRCGGELFAWVNSDDVLLPGCLHAVALCYLANDKPDIIHAKTVYIDSRGRITRFIRVPRQSEFWFFRGVWHGSAPAVFFKSSFFHAVGGLDKKYHLSMDLDLWVRMMKAGAEVSHIPRYLGAYRQHESSKSARSLRTRRTEENPETTKILDVNLPGSNPLIRFLWRRIYKAYQVLNLNYLLAYRDLKSLARRQHWQQAASALQFNADGQKM